MIGRNCCQLALLPWLFHLIPGRLLMFEDPLQGSPLEIVLFASPSLAHFFRQHATTDLNPLIHVLEHLCSSPSITVVVVLPNQISVTYWRVRPRTPLLTILRRSPDQALAFGHQSRLQGRADASADPDRRRYADFYIKKLAFPDLSRYIAIRWRSSGPSSTAGRFRPILFRPCIYLKSNRRSFGSGASLDVSQSIGT